MTSPQAKIRLTVDDEEAKRRLKNNQTAFDRWAKETSKSIESTKRAWGIIRGVVGGVNRVVDAGTDALIKWAKASKTVDREAFQVMERRVGGLRAAWTQFEGALGTGVTNSGVLLNSVDALGGSIEGLNKIFASPQGRDAINGFFGLIAQGAALAISALTGLLRTYQYVFETTGKDARKQALEEGRTAGRRVPIAGGGPAGETFRVRQDSVLEETLKNLERLAAQFRTAAKGGDVPDLKGPAGAAASKLSERAEAILTEGERLNSIDQEIAADRQKTRDKELNQEQKHNQQMLAARERYREQLSALEDRARTERERAEEDRADLLVEAHQQRLRFNQDASAEELTQVLVEGERQRQGVMFALQATHDGAQASLQATQASIELIIGALVNGNKVSGKALAGILADSMIQQGWAFQAQAVALTFEAIANYGATAWRAAAMGSAAKTLLIAGYALKAKSGGFSAAGGASTGGSTITRGGGGGGGFGTSGASAPRPGSTGSGTQVINYSYTFSGPIAGDPKRFAQELRRYQREGDGIRPGGGR